MVVDFELLEQKFVALNGGPQFKFDEAVSLPGLLRDTSGRRSFLEQAYRAWPRGSLRLAERQIRPLLADRSACAAENDDGP